MLLRFLINIFCLFMLLSCATSAPELPPDYHSTNSKITLSDSSFQDKDLARDCESLIKEKNELLETRKKIDEVGEQGRSSDQIAGFIAVLTFWPALAVAGNNNDLTQQINLIQERYDEISLMVIYRNCSKN